MKKLLATVAVTALAAVPILGSGSADAEPVASASKVCSAYAEEHFHDVTANTPGGIKCLGSGEYCSHAPGYAAAYRRAGFKCKANKRLTEL